MSDEEVVASGWVVDTERDRGVRDLRVEAWGADQLQDDFAGRATTDADGQFRIAIERSELDDRFGERRPNLYFRVFHRDELVHETEESVRWDLEAGDTEVVIEIEGLPTRQDVLFEFEPTVAVDVYEQPDREAAVIDQLSPGVRRASSRADGRWYRVRTRQGAEGWIAHDDVPSLGRAVQEFLTPPETPVLDEGKLDTVHDVIDARFHDETARAAFSDRVARLRKEAAVLNVLAHDAHLYLRGDPNAEDRLLTVLETELEPLGVAPESRRPTGGSLGGTPTSPPPRGPDFPGQVPCLVNPRAFAGIQAALVRLARSANTPGEAGVESTYRRYVSNIERPLYRMRQLELLYGAARMAASGGRQSRERFEAVLDAVGDGGPVSGGVPPVGHDARDRIAFADGAPTEPPFDFGIEPDSINFCAEQRARGSARAYECLCKGSYEVHEITNLSQNRPDGEPYDATGCPGDVVSIAGEGFGDSRDWGFVGRKSQVVFAGNEERYSDGTTGVPVAEGDYEAWSNTRVEVRVPEAAESGRVSLRILCEDHDVSKCGIQLKPPTGDHTNRYFEVPDRPVVEEFAAKVPGRGVIRGSEATVDACKPVTFLVEVRDAEEATVRNEEEVSFPAGAAGDIRRIEGETAPVSGSETATYTLRAQNLCHTTESDFELVRRVQIGVDTEPGVVRAGESFDLVVSHTCTPAELGFDLTVVELDADDPHDVLDDVPETVRIGTDETETRVTVDTASRSCTTLEISGDVVENHDDYDRPHTGDTYDRSHDEATVEVFDTPEIAAVRAPDANACDSLTFEVVGNCFSPRRSDETNRVVLEADEERRVLEPPATSGARIVSLSSGGDPPWHGMTLVCESGPRLGERDFDVTVSHHGETSGAVPLTDVPLEFPGPQILEFRADPAEIDPGGPTDIDLVSSVANVERVEVDSLGGPRLDPEPVIHSEIYDTCDTVSPHATHRTWWEHTYELRAFPLGSGPPARRQVTVTERDTGGLPGVSGLPRARSFSLYNCLSPPVDADPDDESDRHATGSNELRVQYAEFDTRGRLVGEPETASTAADNEWLPPEGGGDICPNYGDDDYVQIDLTDGNIYHIVVTERGRPGSVDERRFHSGYLFGDDDAGPVRWFPPNPAPF